MRDDLRTGFEKTKAVLDAVSVGKSKQTPYLAGYVERASRKPIRLMEDIMLGLLALVAGVAALALAVYWMLQSMWLAAGSMIIGYPVLVSFVQWGVTRLRGPKTARDRRDVELQKAASGLKPYMRGRRLSKSLGQATARLLEESARNWTRARTALNDPFWNHENLPGHWRTLRVHALEAVDDAMADLVLITQPYMKPVNPKTDWQDVVGNVVGGLFGVPEQPDNEPLPPVFGAAREISDKLKLLASQVEQATQQVIMDRPSEESIPSATSLDACLGELKSIQQAEGELGQNLRN
jgi:hypothetical protein